MSKQIISTGITPNDGTGDTLSAGASKINSNFTELYTTFGDGVNLTGFQGTTGATGPQGPQGAQGVPGSIGPQGAQGGLGNSGAQGFRGPQGPQGVAGGISFSITNSGSSGYIFNPSILGISTNPTLTLARGFTYFFNVNAPGHPFWIKTVAETGITTTSYNTGTENNGVQTGTLVFTVPNDAPETLYYICQNHSPMQGTINIREVGYIGPQGSQGIRGPQGESGLQGVQGLQGSIGPQGTYGPQGSQGTRGPQGTIGFQGAQGVQGAQGFRGPQGVQGPQGFIGPQGFGPQGNLGPQGVQGPQGAQGPQGIGPQGPQGSLGPQGIQGPQGFQGFIGPQGSQGFQGITGDQGPAGPAGGPQGAAGERGPQGASYWSATVGASAGIHTTVLVGINTNDPITTLDVNGNINFSGNLYKNNQLLLQPVWRTNSTGIHTLSNVGIATTNAASTLTVNGEIAGSAGASFVGVVTGSSFVGDNTLKIRSVVSGATTSITNNGIGTANITGFKSYALMKVGLSTAGWFRLYTDSTSRSNDLSRSIGEDPIAGSGIIAELITTGISTTQIISPFVLGGNLNNPVDSTMYVSIQNLSGVTTTITAELTILKLEA